MDATADPTDSEAFRTLVDLGDKRFGPVAATAVARHVLSVTPGASWTVRRAALEAMVRRRLSARREELVAHKAPATGTGRYVVGAQDGARRPYTTVLWSVEPLRGACDCADFVRNSLGLCKHLWVAVEHVYAAGLAGVAPTRTPTLRWEPVRPLLGRGDWLARVVQDGDGDGDGNSNSNGNGNGDNDGDGAGRGSRPLFSDAQLGSPAGRAAALAVLRRRLDVARAPDPALGALLARDEALAAERARGAVDVAQADAALASLRRTLLPYQRVGVQRFLDDVRLLLADDMGLGKTAQAIAGCHVLWHAQRVRCGLVIVPASLKPQWAREWAAFTDAPLRVVDGTPDERRAAYDALRDGGGFLLLGYEQLVRDIDVVAGLPIEVVVLDEAQRMKNWATKTFKAVQRLRPRHRLVLTGTPLENRLDELGTLLDWLDETALAPAWRLDPVHVLRADGRSEIRGVAHLDTVRARTAHVLLRRTRKSVLGELPTRRDTTLAVPWTPLQAETHAAEDLTIARLVATLSRRPLRPEEHLRLMAALARQRMACNGMALLDFEAVWPTISSHPPTPAVLDGVSSPKLAETRALLEALVVDQGRKVVVFSQWRRMLELVRWVISDVLDAHGLRALFFSGQERPARRTQNIVDFHDDDRARVLLCTDAGGVGLNLQRAASAAVCLELPWNPAVLEQRIARVHRLGQTQPVDVYVVASAQGIEARIAQIVAGKQALFRELFDGTSDEIAVQGGGLLSHVRALAGLDDKDAPAALPAAGQTAEARDDADRSPAGPGGTGDAQSDQTAPGRSAIGDVAHVEHVDDDGSDDDGIDDIGVDDVRGEAQATRHDDGADRGDDDGADRGDHPEARERRPGAAGQGDGPAVSPALTPVLTPVLTPMLTPMLTPTAVAALFAEVRFVPRADGGLTIDAPPAAARGLAALLGGLGALFAHAAGGDPPEGPR